MKGHVDFTYEVSRSLAACEGALLVVDASQGIEAQTLANVYLALENDLEIIPVLNKIDLPAADPDRVAQEIEDTIGLDCTDIVHASAKAGIGIEDILESVIAKVPPPGGDEKDPFRALIFDSLYDQYRGVIVFFRVIDGTIEKVCCIRKKVLNYTPGPVPIVVVKYIFSLSCLFFLQIKMIGSKSPVHGQHVRLRNYRTWCHDAGTNSSHKASSG